MTKITLRNPDSDSALPPVLTGHESAAVVRKVEKFYGSVDAMFEVWVSRCQAYHTQRSYRRHVMSFVEFMGIPWPSESWQLLKTSVADVRAWRSFMDEEEDKAPATLNARLSGLSSFFTFMREAAAEARLPVMVQNPAHKAFIKRPGTKAVRETKALSKLLARKLLSLPNGNDDVFALRDRAILAFYLFTAARITTGCRLLVSDFHMDEDDPTIRITEKGHGKSKRTLGIHAEAADAIDQYIGGAGLVSGPLFRGQHHSKKRTLGNRPMSSMTMYRLLMSYLVRLPRAMKKVELADGSVAERCVYSPHSVRATTATLLADDGANILDVQALLGHAQVTTTQGYFKGVRRTRDSASHKVSI